MTVVFFQRTKNQPKEEVFGTDIPRTSGGHSRGYPSPKLRSGRSKSWKNKHLGADIHNPKARTSTTLRDSQKLRSEKLWAEFSFPIFNMAGSLGQFIDEVPFIQWATHRAGESEPRPTSGSTSGNMSGLASGATSAPTRSPTRAPTQRTLPY